MSKKAFVLLVAILVVSAPLIIGNNSLSESERTCIFSIASWPFPDVYGQGIYEVEVWQNFTGSWVKVDVIDYQNTTDDFVLTPNVGIRFHVHTELNNTIIDASTPSEGNNHIRHNITVLDAHGFQVFSQQNFTSYEWSQNGPRLFYNHYLVFDFLPIESTSYTVIVTCEIYYVS